MKPLKKSVTITLDLPVLDQTRLLAEEEDRSLSSYINLVLKAHLEGRGEIGAGGFSAQNRAEFS